MTAGFFIFLLDASILRAQLLNFIFQLLGPDLDGVALGIFEARDVERAYLVPACEEVTDEIDAEKPGAPGDEIVSHRSSVGPVAETLYVNGPAEGRARKYTSQPADKPSSVRLRALRRCGETIIPLGPRSLAGSSSLPGGFGRAVL